MTRRVLTTLISVVLLLLAASPALAQSGPTPPGVAPAWRVVMFVLLGIVLLALLIWAFAALNRRRGQGETGVEGPPATDEDATPGPTPGEYGTQR